MPKESFVPVSKKIRPSFQGKPLLSVFDGEEET